MDDKGVKKIRPRRYQKGHHHNKWVKAAISRGMRAAIIKKRGVRLSDGVNAIADIIEPKSRHRIMLARANKQRKRPMKEVDGYLWNIFRVMDDRWQHKVSCLDRFIVKFAIPELVFAVEITKPINPAQPSWNNYIDGRKRLIQSSGWILHHVAKSVVIDNPRLVVSTVVKWIKKAEIDARERKLKYDRVMSTQTTISRVVTS